MRYICIICEACGSDGRMDAGEHLRPVTYHCHECKGRSTMWPEPIYTAYQRTKTNAETLISDLTHVLTKSQRLISFTIKECAEKEALDDETLNSIGQIATSIRDLRADYEEKLAAKDEQHRLAVIAIHKSYDPLFEKF